MKLSLKAGTTSKTINLFIQDSSSTTGAGLTGLVYNASGLTAYYALPKAASVAITLATLVAVTSAYSSGGFIEIDATNMPGWYRFDVPNAALAASNSFVSLHLKGATNMAPLPIEIELTAWDNQDGVHGGLSCLPNTAVTTNASLITSGVGTDQLSLTSGAVTAGTVSDKTGYALTAAYNAAKTASQAGDAMTLTAAYNAAKTASQAGDAMALTSGERNSVSDALLARNVAGGSSSGRLVKEALYVLRNKTDIQSGTLTVYQTDDATPAFTAAVTTAAGNPITTIDPA